MEENSLVARYHTDKFMVHSAQKTGYVEPKAHEEECPNYDGILVHVWLENGRYDGPTDYPLTMREPYWTTYGDAIPVDGGTKHLLVSVSYGGQTDKRLLKAIMALIAPKYRPDGAVQGDDVRKR